jgi:hypothetical protein
LQPLATKLDEARVVALAVRAGGTPLVAPAFAPVGLVGGAFAVVDLIRCAPASVGLFRSTPALADLVRRAPASVNLFRGPPALADLIRCAPASVGLAGGTLALANLIRCASASVGLFRGSPALVRLLRRTITLVRPVGAAFTTHSTPALAPTIGIGPAALGPSLGPTIALLLGAALVTAPLAILSLANGRGAEHQQTCGNAGNDLPHDGLRPLQGCSD